MKVKDVISALQKQKPDDEVFMFFQTPDGKLCFTSDVTVVSSGAVRNEHGKLITGVLIMKEIPQKS